MKQRNQAIDILKGIGIILVLVAHSLGGFISQFAYTFHMPLFFIVTGLFMSEFIPVEGKSFGFPVYWMHAVTKDFRRLIIPALFTTACIVVVSSLHYVFPGGYLLAPEDLLINDSVKFGNKFNMLGNLWFLFALFFGKMYFYVVRQLTNEWRLLLTVSFVIGGTAIIAGKFFTLPFCALVGFSLMPYFSIGYIIKRRGGVDIGLPHWGWSFVAVWCVYIFYGGLQVGRMKYSWGYVPDVMAACGGTYFFYQVSKLMAAHCALPAKLLAFCGTHSLVLICAPTVETYCFPFQTILPAMPMRMMAVLVCKVGWCALSMYACMAVPFLKKVFEAK